MASILVTGANTGIGLALCKQLAKDHGAIVYLGSRNAERGAAAVQEVLTEAPDATVQLVLLDVSSDESVQTAAAELAAKKVKLNAIVNNAGRGLGHAGTTGAEILNVNTLGAKRVVDAFLPLLEPNAKDGYARLVHVGSGSGPMYVAKIESEERKQLFCNPNATWEDIDTIYQEGSAKNVSGDQAHAEYGLSKALLALYSMYLARTLGDKKILSFCLSPGYIDTNITKGWPGGKPPSEGTVSIRHCLFEAGPESSGWFYGSDAKRSPLHVLRNPGEEEFNGVYPWEEK
mmetsp:Transcript_14157/g.39157  ORF Transcript_14157/g.39157 Transcript_14157/m.39157 type:complete len:288 (+) Transcript_14157:124-987(+)|eukprot:CAMPEP_0168724302 /NCGR_PEP_ID=MMETSP0724-20121128/3566_1 /TAXON_ID=265536 /ORGANISM="Amphiprora sp., Strain CCMP467" /LENGTH=287 /DNA_ID=CAMNT_0008771047 /DNA_START=55 /DNA_END=921 /DNA_ORIENTATION=-